MAGTTASGKSPAANDRSAAAIEGDGKRGPATKPQKLIPADLFHTGGIPRRAPMIPTQMPVGKSFERGAIFRTTFGNPHADDEGDAEHRRPEKTRHSSLMQQTTGHQFETCTATYL